MSTIPQFNARRNHHASPNDSAAFTAIPHRLVERIARELTACESRLAASLARCSFGWGVDAVAWSLTDAARETGLTPRSILRARRGLVERGLLELGPADGNRPRVHRLRPRPRVALRPLGDSELEPRGCQPKPKRRAARPVPELGATEARECIGRASSPLGQLTTVPTSVQVNVSTAPGTVLFFVSPSERDHLLETVLSQVSEVSELTASSPDSQRGGAITVTAPPVISSPDLDLDPEKTGALARAVILLPGHGFGKRTEGQRHCGAGVCRRAVEHGRELLALGDELDGRELGELRRITYEPSGYCVHFAGPEVDALNRAVWTKRDAVQCAMKAEAKRSFGAQDRTASNRGGHFVTNATKPGFSAQSYSSGLNRLLRIVRAARVEV